MGKVTAIIAAAGKGKRMGGNINKQFLMLQEKPVLIHTLHAFNVNPTIDDIIVVVAEADIEYIQELLLVYSFEKTIKIIAGGTERQNSVFNGLQNCHANTEIVLVHDGARPMVTGDLINKAIDSARDFGAVSVAVPVKDTIKLVDVQYFVKETPNRNHLWLIQTPQAFKYHIIKKAHLEAQESGYLGTDDAGLVERMGHPVKLIMGNYENIKVTTPEDIMIAEALLVRRQK